MKKIMILISISFLLFLSAGVKADSYPASPTDWQVTFNGKELTSNYDEASVAAAVFFAGFGVGVFFALGLGMFLLMVPDE